MAGTRAAIRYAKAILDVANEKGVASEVNNDMLLVASTIGNNAELTGFISSPTVSVEIKENALVEIFSASNGVTKGLFHLLFENKRFEILDDIASEYSRLFDEMNNVEVATVTTAVPLDEEMTSKVMAKAATFTDKKVNLVNVVDPAIIGGFILRIGDQQYNASIANRLHVLKRELAN
ncbi:MAG TPA: ATP synthase F1 subunit delta [Flavobacterium sp.]|jgi:F-type H+-transporting ATPase subunit delta